MHRDSKTGLCLGEAYDWRSWRTKAAFLGSAVSMALVATLCVWLIEVRVAHMLGMVPPIWVRIGLVLAAYIPAALVLARSANRHWSAELDRRKERPAGSRRFRWNHEIRSRWELRADVTWSVAALLVYWIAATTALGLPISGGSGGNGDGNGGLVLVMGGVPLVFTTNYSIIPVLLDRWGTRNPEAEQADG